MSLLFYHTLNSHILFGRLLPEQIILAERVGFEPTAPFGVTGFQDQLLKPLGHLSMSDNLLIAAVLNW